MQGCNQNIFLGETKTIWWAWSIYPSPPHRDRVKPFCILEETILQSSLSISCFLSFMYPSKNVAKNVDRWSSFKNSEYLNCNFIYFFFQVCTVDKKLSIYFIFSFYLLPFSFYSKSVDRGTSSENSGELMVIVCVSLFKSVDKMLFVLFYFPSTLYPLKVFFAQSVDRWTSYDNSENFNGIHMYFII